eukprot:496418_1
MSNDIYLVFNEDGVGTPADQEENKRKDNCMHEFLNSLTMQQRQSYDEYLTLSKNTPARLSTYSPAIMFKHWDIEDGEYAKNIFNSTIKKPDLKNVISKVRILSAKYGRGSVYMQCGSLSAFKKSIPDSITKLAKENKAEPIICWALRYDPMFTISDTMIWMPSKFVMALSRVTNTESSLYTYNMNFEVNIMLQVWYKYPEIPVGQFQNFRIESIEFHPKQHRLQRKLRKYFVERNISRSAQKFQQKFPDLLQFLKSRENLLNRFIHEYIGFFSFIDDILDLNECKVHNLGERFVNGDTYDVIVQSIFLLNEYSELLKSVMWKNEIIESALLENIGNDLRNIILEMDFEQKELSIVEWWVFHGNFLRYKRKMLQFENLKCNILGRRICANCGKSDINSIRKYQKCVGCRFMFYCSHQCQKKDWKRKHRAVCSLYSLFYCLCLDF